MHERMLENIAYTPEGDVRKRITKLYVVRFQPLPVPGWYYDATYAHLDGAKIAAADLDNAGMPHMLIRKVVIETVIQTPSDACRCNTLAYQHYSEDHEIQRHIDWEDMPHE